MIIVGWDCESNREIVFVSFVCACVRAGGRGEAKLCGRVRRCCFRGWVVAAPVVLRCVWRAPPQVGEHMLVDLLESCMVDRCSFPQRDDN